MKKLVVWGICFTIPVFLLAWLSRSVYRVDGHSMQQTLLSGDRVWLSGKDAVNRGDIVIFQHHGQAYIKRCAGMPGDTVVLQEGRLLVNGLPADPPAAAAPADSGDADNLRIVEYYGQNWTARNFGPLVVPFRGCKIPLSEYNSKIYEYIIRTDAGINSAERYTDFVRNHSQYQFENDYYFLLGDNRLHSDDSRVMGPVPATGIIGKTSLVVYSWAGWNRFFLKLP